MLKEQTKAPDFTLNNADGISVSLNELHGKKVVLYFYPRDNTPGCTKEACAFRDLYAQFVKKDAVVMGISKDTEGAHRSFIKKYSLPFVLLSDPDCSVIKQYEAWGEKKMYGKTIEGTLRITYLIDENGIIEKVFPKVSPEKHAHEILELL